MVAKKACAKKAMKSGKASRKRSLAMAYATKKANHAVETVDHSSPRPSLSEEPSQSASKRKLHLFDTSEPTSPTASSLPIAIVDLNLVESLFSSFKCQECDGTLRLTADTRKGFTYKLTVLCMNCKNDTASTMTSSTLRDSRHYDINRLMTLSFLNIGVAYAVLSSFCESIGMAGLTDVSYQRHVAQIHKSSRLLTEESLIEAAAKVREASGSLPDTVTDISVSYDGTWQKKGHTSRSGMGAIIDVATGLVVDFHVIVLPG